MVKKKGDKIALEINKLNEPEIATVLEYISKILTARRNSAHSEKIFNDDLITSLSDKRENRCARQVVEWEKTRRKSFSRAV